MGLFVTIEGGEGTGKSTQVGLLCDRLSAQGHRVVQVHEPGGTELGMYLRDYLKATNKPLTSEAELFLFVAARSELVRRVIRPALEAGDVVVSDRYADSTTVYQGYGRRIPMRHVQSANRLATAGLWPAVTVVLDAPPEVSLTRARIQTPLEDERDERQRELDGQQRAQESGKQRFEEAGAAFHRRVRDGFLKLAAQEPERFLVLDATQGEEVLAEQVWQRVAAALGSSSTTGMDTGRLPGL